MKYLFDRKEEIADRLCGRTVAVFMDYDGTIMPIVKTPDTARITRQAKDSLLSLKKAKHCIPAIISGRALHDIKSMVGIKGLIYAGNHGMDVSGPGLHREQKISKKTGDVMRKIFDSLKSGLIDEKGVMIENKITSVGIHYRLAGASSVRKIRKMLAVLSAAGVRSGILRVTKGKKVFEVRPSEGWNKGDAVRWILNKLKHKTKMTVPVYIGDDLTDEDAFRALAKTGITVCVGKKRSSAAQYYLNDTKEVHMFLKVISKATG